MQTYFKHINIGEWFTHEGRIYLKTNHGRAWLGKKGNSLHSFKKNAPVSTDEKSTELNCWMERK